MYHDHASREPWFNQPVCAARSTQARGAANMQSRGSYCRQECGLNLWQQVNHVLHPPIHPEVLQCARRTTTPHLRESPRGWEHSDIARQGERRRARVGGQDVPRWGMPLHAQSFHTPHTPFFPAAHAPPAPSRHSAECREHPPRRHRSPSTAGQRSPRPSQGRTVPHLLSRCPITSQ